MINRVKVEKNIIILDDDMVHQKYNEPFMEGLSKIKQKVKLIKVRCVR
jgi:hypothetical protein